MKEFKVIYRALIESAAGLTFHVDAFSVPVAARSEFAAAMRRNLAFIETLPGFRGHVAFEKTGGPTAFNLVTIAAWESSEALAEAGLAVRAHYQEIGFDLAAALARWGATIERGTFCEEGPR
jgi:heme-degrading monooxygenase HmoA